MTIYMLKLLPLIFMAHLSNQMKVMGLITQEFLTHLLTFKKTYLYELILMMVLHGKTVLIMVVFQSLITELTKEFKEPVNTQLLVLVFLFRVTR